MTLPKQVELSYAQTHDISVKVLEVLSGLGVPMGYAMLGCALTIGRLIQYGKELSEEQEIAFCQDLMNWAGAYFAEGKVN